MESVRRAHNYAKRLHIEANVPRGSRVLDVGCGRGGDLMKWKNVGARVDMCDPDRESLQEAIRRAKGGVHFFHGDILSAEGVYDVVCYNFSLQYIFKSEEYFFKSIQKIKECLRVGGKLIGCIPDSDHVLHRTPFRDEYGNTMVRRGKESGGNFGEILDVHLVDTPYYSNGDPIPEPIAYKDLLVTHLSHLGIHLVKWEPLVSQPCASISTMYSRFIFLHT